MGKEVWGPCGQKQIRRGGCQFYVDILCEQVHVVSFSMFSISVLLSLFIKFCNVFSCDVIFE